MAHRALGTALARLGELDAATVAVTQALELAHRTGTVEEVAGLQLNLGQLLVMQERYDDALPLQERAVAEFERLGHGSGRAIARGNLAENLLLLGRVDEALDMAEQACAFAGAIGHTGTLADAGLTAARALMALGRGAESQQRAAVAAGYFAEAGDDDGQHRALALAAGSGDLVT
jgi:tetratricopeptide (TPR) repeat protein